MSQLNLTPEDINWFFPIFGVTAYGKVLIVHRACRMPIPKSRRKPNKQKISKTTRRSLDKMIFTVGSSLVRFTSLITLTYGQNYPVNGRRVKADLNQFLVYIKRSFGAMSYVWFLEFQRRNAPHIHIITTLPEPDQCRRELFATIWADISEDGNWPYTEVKPPYRKSEAGFGMNTKDAVFRQHRRKRNWEALRSSDGAIRYMLKYASKQYQKKVPHSYRDVGRFWASSRDVRPHGGTEVPMNENEVRLLLRSVGRDFTNFAVLPKIIFLP